MFPKSRVFCCLPRLSRLFGLVSIMLCLGPVVAGAAPLKLQGIKGNDDRERVDIQQFPWNTIGRINKDGSFCTGILIARNKVLTAAHCFWNKKTRRWSQAKYFHFVLGYEKGKYVAAAKGLSYKTAFKKLPDLNQYPLKRQNDWAVLTIDKDLGDQFGFVSVSSSKGGRYIKENRSPGDIIQAGYSRDFAHVLTVHRGCDIVQYGTLNGEKAPIFLHDCDATNGDSGSPLFIKTENTYTLIGIHSATIRAKNQPALGIAVPSFQFSNTLNSND